MHNPLRIYPTLSRYDTWRNNGFVPNSIYGYIAYLSKFADGFGVACKQKKNTTNILKGAEVNMRLINLTIHNTFRILFWFRLQTFHNSLEQARVPPQALRDELLYQSFKGR